MASDLFARLRTVSSREFFSAPDLDVAATGENGQSLLQEAIAFAKTDIARELVARKVPLDTQNRKGQTALHYAAIYGALELAELILSSGGDPNLVDKSGNGPLWAAALSTNRNPRIIALLVSHGADPRGKNKAGRSVLDFARQSGNKDLWVACGGAEGDFDAGGA